jgi:hypothetical protein
MFPDSEAANSTADAGLIPPEPSRGFDWRLLAALLLLAPAAAGTWWTIERLEQRRAVRTELAEISHARYGMLNPDRWVEKVLPILNTQIDALDWKAKDQTNLRPTVVNALYRLLDDIKTKMSAPPAGSSGGLLSQGNAMMANMMIGALKPHVPEYADVVLAEMARPETKQALKNYVRTLLGDAAKNTFGNVDMRWYNYVTKKHECADLVTCQQKLGNEIAAQEGVIQNEYLAALAASALAFLIVLTGGPLSRLRTIVLLLYCAILLGGGILTPMLEVEARITRLGMTFMGTPISFADQSLYYQSKSVLEVFRTLIQMGKAEMWVVGVLVLLFSVVFPVLKILTLCLCLIWPRLLRGNRIVKFFALDSSKWSMADVMALAIFMSYVAFNGVIHNTMGGLQELGAQIAIPTDSSKILPGYYLFIGFCLASLFLSKKLERGLKSG